MQRFFVARPHSLISCNEIRIPPRRPEVLLPTAPGSITIVHQDASEKRPLAPPVTSPAGRAGYTPRREPMTLAADADTERLLPLAGRGDPAARDRLLGKHRDRLV